MNDQGTGGLQKAPFFSSQDIGGKVNFRFMREPVAWIADSFLRKNEIRSPGALNTGCWLQAEMAEGGNEDDYQRELNVCATRFANIFPRCIG